MYIRTCRYALVGSRLLLVACSWCGMLLLYTFTADVFTVQLQYAMMPGWIGCQMETM